MLAKGVDSESEMRYHLCMDVQTNNIDDGTQRSSDTGPCCGIDGMPEARFFKALCDPTRLRILAHLVEAQEPKTVSEVADLFPIDVSVVSRHLAILRDQQILLAEKHGKEVRYTADYGFLRKVLIGFATAIENCCPTDECCHEAE